jgi:predicted aspartyl protease
MATEQIDMGRVTVQATIENLEDLWEVERGLRQPEQVRRVTVPNALVDTGASLLSIPRSMIEQLGLSKIGRKKFTTARGETDSDLFSLVRLAVQGRYCNADVSEVAEKAPVLIGQIPLELMDWVVDCKNQALIGNPEHGGEWKYELY